MIKFYCQALDFVSANALSKLKEAKNLIMPVLQG